jgi:hypothetical protein
MSNYVTRENIQHNAILAPVTSKSGAYSEEEEL